MNKFKSTFWKVISTSLQKYERNQLNRQKFAIISNNCWGYQLYNNLNRPYNTLFVGLFLHSQCYLNFLDDFHDNLSADITFITQSRYIKGAVAYPIGLVNNLVEIHFLHYQSEKEAKEKWQRRCKRLQQDMLNNTPLYVKFCESENSHEENILRFHQLPFEDKISFSLRKSTEKRHFALVNLKDENTENLINGKALYKRRYQYINITEWIQNKNIKKRMYLGCFS
jgi:uncharacterized protein (DUF1919 family)